MNFKAIPFINSSRRKEYYDFVNQPFNLGMVGLINGEYYNGQAPFFHDWHGTSMVHWIKFSKEKFDIEFYVDNDASYTIRNKSLVGHKEFTLPYPKTIDHFISDMYRCGITLEWSDHILKSNDKKNILSVSDYKIYIEDLLKSIGKGEED